MNEKNANHCPDCGHQHEGAMLGFICIGCPCLAVRVIDPTPADGLKSEDINPLNYRYGLDRRTREIVRVFEMNGQNVHREAAKWVDSHGLPEAYEYYTASRYELAKKGLFPNNKAGNSALVSIIRNLTTRPTATPAANETLIQLEDLCAECGRDAESHWNMHSPIGADHTFKRISPEPDAVAGEREAHACRFKERCTPVECECGWHGLNCQLLGGGQIADSGDSFDAYCPKCDSTDWEFVQTAPAPPSAETGMGRLFKKAFPHLFEKSGMALRERARDFIRQEGADNEFSNPEGFAIFMARFADLEISRLIAERDGLARDNKELVEGLEEAAVLLAEVHFRFNQPHLLNEDFNGEDKEMTYGDAAKMFNDLAKKIREGKDAQS